MNLKLIGKIKGQYLVEEWTKNVQNYVEIAKSRMLTILSLRQELLDNIINNILKNTFNLK